MLGQLLAMAREGMRSRLARSAGNMPATDDALEGETRPVDRIPNVSSSHLAGRGLAQFSTAQWAGGIGPTLQLAPPAIPKRAALKYRTSETAIANGAKVPAVFIPTQGL